MKRSLLLPVLLCGLHASLTWVSAAPRVALVIGNSRYSGLPDSRQLTSPAADATDVAAALKSLGYTIVTDGAVTNASRERMTSVTEQFSQAAKGAEAALFYFSGHGIQVGDDNFLLPSDTPALTGISVLKNRTVLLRDSVMVALEEADAQTKVIILDCCRDNPFSAQLAAALAQTGKSVKTKSVGEITGYGPGFYLAFATSPGQTAADGNGQRNSPFTAAMLKTISTSADKDIDFFFRDVKKLLPRDQVSWTNHSIDGEFVIGPQNSARIQPLPQPKGPSTPTPLPAQSAQQVPRAGQVMEIMLPGNVPMKFCWCPPGSFMMGSPPTEVGRGENEKQIRVQFPKGFWLAQTECNQVQWEAVMGNTPSEFTGDNLPVEKVSFSDVATFLKKLNRPVELVESLGGGRWIFTLPSEAQWEYACRAGTASPYSFGPSLNKKLSNFGGDYSFSGGDAGAKITKTTPAGTFPANSWGLFDMHGNVWEWCSDKYSTLITNQKDSELGGQGGPRVVRGGSWSDIATYCRSARRGSMEPSSRNRTQGFRPVLVPSS